MTFGSGGGTVFFGGNLTSDDTVLGGAGFDTVSASLTAAGSFDGHRLDGVDAAVEAVRFDGAFATTADTSVGRLANFSTYIAGTGSTVTLNNLGVGTGRATGTTVLLVDTSVTKVTLSAATDLKLKFAGTGGGAVLLSTLGDASGLTTLELQSTGSGGATITTDSLTAPQTLTGSGNFTITNALATTSFNASAFTGNLTLKAGNTATAITGGSGNNTIVGGTGADTLVLGAGNDVVTLGATGSNAQPGADTITTGAGNDVVRFTGNVTTTNTSSTSYSGAPSVTDFDVASDKLGFSVSTLSFTAKATTSGLSKGSTAASLTSGAMVLQTVAQDAGSVAKATNVSFLKLASTGNSISDSGTLGAFFSAALGSTTVTTLASSGNYLVSAYDSVAGKAVIAVANPGNSGTATALDGADFTTGVSLVGVLTMSSTDYALFGAGNLVAF